MMKKRDAVFMIVMCLLLAGNAYFFYNMGATSERDRIWNELNMCL